MECFGGETYRVMIFLQILMVAKISFLIRKILMIFLLLDFWNFFNELMVNFHAGSNLPWGL
jgi:hypothetical protein